MEDKLERLRKTWTLLHRTLETTDADPREALVLFVFSYRRLVDLIEAAAKVLGRPLRDAFHYSHWHHWDRVSHAELAKALSNDFLKGPREELQRYGEFNPRVMLSEPSSPRTEGANFDRSQ
jgi:hypothetical protein